MELCLEFLVEASRCYLDRTTFSHPLLSRQIQAQRGVSVRRGISSFHWSRGVQGLSVLCAQAVLSRLTGAGTPSIVGEVGSLALSLDYALSKESAWLSQIFGQDSDGRPLLRRMVTRVNPERKRPGPVEVSLKPEVVHSIRLKVDGREITGQADVEALLHGLQHASDAPGESSERLTSFVTPDVNSPSSWLFDVIRREVLVGLHETENFQDGGSQSNLSYLARYEPFQKIGGSPAHLTSQLDLTLSDSARMGLGFSDAAIARQLMRSDPIRILCGVGGVTSLCIFRYLTEVKKYNLEISHKFSSSQDIVRSLRDETLEVPVDGVIMALCCSVRLCQGRSQFEPLMLMPLTTHAKVQHGTGDRRYLFLTDVVTGSQFHMVDEQRFSRQEVNVGILPIAGMEKAISQNHDSQAILFWPYYLFAAGNNDWLMDSGFERRTAYEQVSLCVSKRIAKNRALALALDIAIRDAWLVLRSKPEVMDQMIRSLLSEPEFLGAFSRCLPVDIFGSRARQEAAYTGDSRKRIKIGSRERI
jgi:hypothetical protein